MDGRRVTVSAAPSFAAKWLMPRLGKFEAEHPEVDVWLTAGMELVDFASGEVDIAIRYGSGRYPGLEVTRLMTETVLPVCAPALLDLKGPWLGPEDLARHTLLHDGSPDADDSCPDWAMWLTARGIKGVDGARGPRFSQSSLVIESAVNGRGVALAKRALAQADLDAGRLVTPVRHLHRRGLRLLSRASESQGAASPGEGLRRLDRGRSGGARGAALHHRQRRGNLRRCRL